MIPLVSTIVAATASTPAEAMETALGTVANNALSVITNIIPVAAPVLGGILVVGIAIKAFKKLAGR